MTAQEIREILTGSRLFSGLDAALIDALSASARRRSVAPGQYLFLKGDAADALWGVLSGSVATQVSTEDGKELVLDTFQSGDVFGEVGVLDFGPRRVSAVVVSPGEVFRIARNDFLAHLQRSPELCFRVLSLLCTELRDSTEALEETALYTLPNRLAKLVLTLASNPDGVRPELKLSQYDLARYLGVHRTTVNRQLRDWEKQGWLSLGRERIILHKIANLEELAPPHGRDRAPINTWPASQPRAPNLADESGLLHDHGAPRTAALLAVDAADYAQALMVDAAGTLQRLRSGLAAIDRAVARHGGRTVAHPGDRVLAEFPTAQAALDAAGDIFAITTGAAESKHPAGDPVFRIGVHYGDVVVGEDVILGEAVNVAQQMTRLALAGGIVLSGQVLEAIDPPSALDVQFLGRHTFENAGQAVALYSARPVPLLSRVRLRIESWIPRPMRGVTAALLAVFAGTVLWMAGERQGTRGLPEVQWSSSIVVLPFAGANEDHDERYFSSGVSDDIRNRLVSLPGLRVIGQASAASIGELGMHPRDVGGTLGVDWLLTGSVLRGDGQSSIVAQLVNARDGTIAWSRQFDLETTDANLIQQAVIAAVAGTLNLQRSSSMQQWRPTQNAQAYAQYLRARAAYGLFDLLTAESLLLDAIASDPKFAEAHELLAATYWRLAGETIPAAEGQRRMAEAAKRALDIDPDLVFANALYHSGNPDTWSYAVEIEALEVAAQSQPSNPEILNALAYDLLLVGYARESLEVARRAVDVDPLSLAALSRLIDALIATGQPGEAASVLARSAQMGNQDAHYNLGVLKLVEGSETEALTHFETYMGNTSHSDPDWIESLVQGSGDRTTGQAFLDRRKMDLLAATEGDWAYNWQIYLDAWYLYRGYLEHYFNLVMERELGRSAWTDAEMLIQLGVVYRQTGFTAHPRYLDVARALGFTDIWVQRGPPDFCTRSNRQWTCE